MKTILFILLPFIIFGQVIIHNIPCTDDAANTIVTNNGTGAAWVASHNTEDLTSGGTMFVLNTNSEYIKSAENWTAEKLTITWNEDLLRAESITIEIHIVNGDGSNNDAINKFFLSRASGTDEWQFQAHGATGTLQTKETTDFTGDITPHDYILIVDASVSPWNVTLSVDGTLLTWGAWDGNPAVAEFNSLIFFGTTSIFEPDANIKDILIWETLDDANSNYKDYANNKSYKGY